MRLRAEPFYKIQNGTKKVESRLFDEKHQQINIGDVISFILKNDDDSLGEKIDVNVVGLLVYPSFETMMNDIPPQWFGWDESIQAIEEINTFYSVEEQNKYNVVGIRIEKI